MGTGFLLLYKRFEDGRLSWPRTTQEAADLTEEQYRYLMMGLNPLNPKIKDVDPKKILCKTEKFIFCFLHINSFLTGIFRCRVSETGMAYKPSGIKL